MNLAFRIHVDNKKRGYITTPLDISYTEVEYYARQDPIISPFLKNEIVEQIITAIPLNGIIDINFILQEHSYEYFFC